MQMPAHNRVLVIEGDRILRDILVEQLSSVSDFNVVAREDGELARVVVQDDAFDIVLADSALPEVDGRGVVAMIRDEGFRGPIILLTSQAHHPDLSDGPATGASEIVTKPFKFAVLIARMRALMRVHEASEDAAVTIGPYTFRAGAKTLTSQLGGLLRLTEKEAAILRFLYRAGDDSVGRDTLLQEVWGYNASVTTHTLETHIYRLRQKLEADPLGGGVLVTEVGGYRLMP